MARTGQSGVRTARRPKPAPTLGVVSLGCPKALVDSERILTRLRAEGYAVTGSYEAADVVLVNTCGFLDSAKRESLDAIGEAIAENGRVIVTGCLGVEAERIRAEHPKVLAITGPQQYEQVVEAVHAAVPPAHDPIFDLVPPQGVKLTPRHYAYLKISEGCNNRCRFCIIPSIRGDLVSRPIHHVLAEAERLVQAGVKELLVISQDTSAYGVDLKHAPQSWRGRERATRFYELADALGELGIWVRLHYVYPYPHVDRVIELMAKGSVLPYLDIPFQHASPRVLKAMRRPADQGRMLERLAAWRRAVPDLAIRSTFIVGFPGESEADFRLLLDWLEAAELDRVGCFRYEAVEGATANALPDPVPEPVKEERWHRFMQAQRQVSRRKLAAKVGRRLPAILDQVGLETIGRSMADAPEIDGTVRIAGAEDCLPGDIVEVAIAAADDYDLRGERVRAA
jgi:ribosomal protein S12 methylthiotransferase